MKETATIKIEKRVETNSRASRKLRKIGYLPGNVYGKGMEPIAIKVKEDDFRKSLSKYGRNHLFNIDLAGQETYSVMVKEIQYSPVKREILNVNFHKISLAEETKVDLKIRIIGNKALESNNLLLSRQMDTIPVKGLPQDIPDNIEIDVSGLEEGEKIYIKDINFPKGIVPEVEDDQTVLYVNTSITMTEDEDEGNEIGDLTEEANEEKSEEIIGEV